MRFIPRPSPTRGSERSTRRCSSVRSPRPPNTSGWGNRRSATRWRGWSERSAIGCSSGRPREVQPTAKGRALHDRISAAFDRIDHAVAAASAPDAGVTISVSASLATHWLLPRLPEFKRRHPEVELRVIATDRDRSAGRDDAHLWIPLGTVTSDELVATEFPLSTHAGTPGPAGGRSCRSITRSSLRAVDRDLHRRAAAAPRQEHARRR
jgi:DNA-binding transcriptional LysR family regulator